MTIALVVETGAGLSNANSYISQADADTYLTNWYGDSEWTAAVAAADGSDTAALYYACYALERLYGRKYLSIPPTGGSQSLLWPRYTFVDNTSRLVSGATIPQCLKDAQCELAIMFLQGLSLFPNETETQLIKSQDISIGDLKSSQAFWKPSGDAERYDGFRKVDLILYPILQQADNSGVRMGL